MATLMLAMPWHEGEEKMHRLMHVPSQDNPTVSALSGQAANMIVRAPLIAVGALDTENRPWTTIWGGTPGLSQPLGNSIIGFRTPVDKDNDPVVKILFGDKADGEVVREQGQGRMVGGLAIDLDTRKRVKFYGRMVAGAVSTESAESNEGDGNSENETHQEGLVQLVVRVDQSLGNCPKYLNRKEIKPANPKPELVSKSSNLTEDATNLVAKADLFFVSSAHSNEDMDTNHRGGPPGFIRTQKNDDGSFDIIWPEYSGNRLYQTLGNLQTTPFAGLAVPDFETGDVLYVTGETEVLIGADAASVIPRSNLAVRLTVQEARFVKQGLPFRGIAGERSPYNPKVRPLADETAIKIESEKVDTNAAKLLSKIPITPTVTRFRFSLNNPGTWKAGQWVALDFSEELDMGYSHMRDDDPLSINDDFVRTFTISSPPAPREKKSDDEFEITVRNVGTVTDFLFNGGKFEVPIRGFGGDVKIEQSHDDRITPFVAGGVGITPLLAQLPDLTFKQLHVFWTVHIDDIDLVIDTISSHPGLGKSMSLFITGSNEASIEQKNDKVDQLKESTQSLVMRRLEKQDLQLQGMSNRWNLCVSTRLRRVLLEWLEGKEVVFEDFNF